MACEKDLLATQYPRSTQTSQNEVQERAERSINMEENSRLGEISKPNIPTPLGIRIKSPRKKKINMERSLENTTITPPSGVCCGYLPRNMQH
ncbi:hypothetical protein AHAS_Ahas06G0182700 [Arachis hypogaea]